MEEKEKEDKLLGVYIHIPFCASKCGYCDFYSLANCDGRMNKYQAALLRHIEEAAATMSPYYIDTIYFGGGTPSYYGAKRLTEIFNAVKRFGKVLKSAEVTVECNPDSVTRHDLRLLRKEGVNRISLGMQSASDDLLKIIGRRHSFAQVKKAVQMIRAEGFDNLSLDLMYGLPNQTKADWAQTLARAIELEPEHLSCYGLKLEEGTPMYDAYQDSPVIPTDDEQADMYLYAVETLAHYGYQQYEVSNFAKRGYASRHNMKYWDMDDYLGFGPGAHSCIGNTRYGFVRSLEGYIRGVERGEDLVEEYERLEELDRAAEYLMLGMRRGKGISQEEYYKIYRSDFAPIEALLKEYEKDGWTKSFNGRWCFTPAGFLVSNILIGSLWEAQAEHRISGKPWMEESMGGDIGEIIHPSQDE
ncbi:MAG: radical SAM family heme chaperone HemW [Oscillospiraceae bacterium]|nr:radical SAM family heme chaperone HemW [Oscillospiraceae bacterium]MCD7748446.1 radical SAM family heme chaperone HemW [Oscillospiraceae bacterium]